MAWPNNSLSKFFKKIFLGDFHQQNDDYGWEHFFGAKGYVYDKKRVQLRETIWDRTKRQQLPEKTWMQRRAKSLTSRMAPFVAIWSEWASFRDQDKNDQGSLPWFGRLVKLLESPFNLIFTFFRVVNAGYTKVFSDLPRDYLLDPLRRSAATTDNALGSGIQYVLWALLWVPMAALELVRGILYLPTILLEPEIAYRELANEHPLLGKLAFFAGGLTIISAIALFVPVGPLLGVPPAWTSFVAANAAVIYGPIAAYLFYKMTKFTANWLYDVLFPLNAEEAIDQVPAPEKEKEGQTAEYIASQLTIAKAAEAAFAQVERVNPSAYIQPEGSPVTAENKGEGKTGPEVEVEAGSEPKTETETEMRATTFTRTRIIFAETRAEHFLNNQANHTNFAQYIVVLLDKNGFEILSPTSTSRNSYDWLTKLRIGPKKTEVVSTGKDSHINEKFSQEADAIAKRIVENLEKWKQKSNFSAHILPEHLRADLEEYAYAMLMASAKAEDYKTFKKSFYTRLSREDHLPLNLEQIDSLPDLTSANEANLYKKDKNKFKNTAKEKIVDIALLHAAPNIRATASSEIIHLRPQPVKAEDSKQVKYVLASDHAPLKASFDIGEERLTALSWNVNLMFGEIDTHKSTAKHKLRVPLIAQTIREHATDVVALQEAFSPADVERLIKLLKDDYIAVRMPTAFAHTSGNLMFVKRNSPFKLTQNKAFFQPFNPIRDIAPFSHEVMSVKGLASIELRVPGTDDKYIKFNGFHLIAGGSGKFCSTEEPVGLKKDRMMGDIASCIENQRKDPNCVAVLTMGDGNVAVNTAKERLAVCEPSSPPTRVSTTSRPPQAPGTTERRFSSLDALSPSEPRFYDKCRGGQARLFAAAETKQSPATDSDDSRFRTISLDKTSTSSSDY